MPEFVRRVPDGDDRERLICGDCGHIAYENPKIVVGAVVVADDGRILLCRRAIPPRHGYWTLPAGYMEMGETLEEGAAREAWEEARAHITIEGMLGIFSISRIGQVQIIYRARFTDAASFEPGPESLDVALFAYDDIPWDEMAFPTGRWALEAWRENQGGQLGHPVGNPAEDPRGVRRAGTPPPGGGL